MAAGLQAPTLTTYATQEELLQGLRAVYQEAQQHPAGAPRYLYVFQGQHLKLEGPSVARILRFPDGRWLELSVPPPAAPLPPYDGRLLPG